ncbi:cytochrome d ubiquinol oxidase subunit II [Nocardiopsis kunsanensis]|uniref:cytochrome d ubiquinol oxidase subunit II n=1 Tax=Nocardiopsis kunsanensis TaxID=141693 RepID=UPI000348F722|nr:cytochrome d ubiquinol oxidase subunit II [Nocardiopsis kunsanensis]
MEIAPALFLTGLIVGYFVLAGCDIGLGMAAPYLARTPAERRRLVSAIAPYFLGSEVWLVGAVGVVAGLFPSLKDVLFEGGMWAVSTVLLTGWLMRDAGLWLRARVDTGAWRSVCDSALVSGSWLLALSWGLIIGGLLSGGDPLTPFSLVCALTVAVLFLLRGAAFGAERLVPADGSASGHTGPATAPEADQAAWATRVLARTGLATTAVTAALVAFPGTGPAVDRPLLLAAVAAVPATALAITSGLSGPHLSRHTSAVAIAAVPLLAGALNLPLGTPPAGTLLLTGGAILPVLPLMVVGQVALHRMLRRPADDHGFFVTPPPQDSQPGRTVPVS